MMFTTNFKQAIAALKASKWRSLMTMLGVIIGVVSVVTTVSIGEGIKRQVQSQINELGADLITIMPGKVVSRDESGAISDVNISGLLGRAGSLNEGDWQAVQQTPGVKTAIPLSLVGGVPRTSEREFSSGYVIGTTDKLLEIVNKKIEYGEFFTENDANPYMAVIGKRVAEQLFNESVPIGKSFELRGQSFMVRGVFEEFETSSISPSSDFNSIIFINYNTGKKLNENQAHILQVLAKPKDPSNIESVVSGIRDNLQKKRAGQDDFTILRQEENLALTNNVLTLLTSLVAGIAAISLLVGGIGIMNIMLVSVTERTHEVGVRKAVGATNGQIYSQFLVEAAILSFMGGAVGIILSILINFLLRIFTNLQPVVTLSIVLLSASIALIVGIIFGLTPALKAARKDPIEALRHE